MLWKWTPWALGILVAFLSAVSITLDILRKWKQRNSPPIMSYVCDKCRHIVEAHCELKSRSFGPAACAFCDVQTDRPLVFAGSDKFVEQMKSRAKAEAFRAAYEERLKK